MAYPRRMLAVSMLLALILLGGCGGSPTPASSSSGGSVPLVSVSGGPSGLKLIPVDIQATPGDAGWKNYKVSVAVENPGPAVVDVGHISDTGIVETQEGTKYNVDITNWGGSVEALLPPHFRGSGVSFTFRAAETVHPTKVQFSKFGTVDLTAPQKVAYPADTLPTTPHAMSEPLKTKNAQITFKQLQNGPPLALTVVMENLDKAQNNNSVVPQCYVIDGVGQAHSLKITEAITLGPGQKEEKTFPFTNNLTRDNLSAAVMLCYNNYDPQSGQGTVDMFRLE